MYYYIILSQMCATGAHEASRDYFRMHVCVSTLKAINYVPMILNLYIKLSKFAVLKHKAIQFMDVPLIIKSVS